MKTQLPQFFAQLLGLVEPWYISRIEQQELEVHIHVDFTRGAKFPYKETFCPVHDTNIRQWRHMNLFQYRTYIHARVPRIQAPDGIQPVAVPCAREGSGFTLLFEAMALQLAQMADTGRGWNPSNPCVWMKDHETRDTGT